MMNAKINLNNTDTDYNNDNSGLSRDQLIYMAYNIIADLSFNKLHKAPTTDPNEQKATLVIENLVHQMLNIGELLMESANSPTDAFFSPTEILNISSFVNVICQIIFSPKNQNQTYYQKLQKVYQHIASSLRKGMGNIKLFSVGKALFEDIQNECKLYKLQIQENLESHLEIKSEFSPKNFFSSKMQNSQSYGF